MAAALVAAATALPIGTENVENVALVAEEAGSPAGTFLHKQADAFQRSINQVQTGMHPDSVSQALSTDMSEETDEAKELASLEKDAENVGEDSEDKDLGEAKDDYLPVDTSADDASESAEEKKLDRMAKDAKKNEKKTEKGFDSMASSMKEQAEVKKGASSVKAEASKALAAAAALDDKESPSTELGDGKDDEDEEAEIKKLDKMAHHLKHKEKKTIKNMKSVESGYEKEEEATKKMKKEMAEFKKETSAANKLADTDDPTEEELGEDDDDLDSETDALEQLQKSTVQNMEDDEVQDMVAHGKREINSMASTALESINQLP